MNVIYIRVVLLLYYYYFLFSTEKKKLRRTGNSVSNPCSVIFYNLHMKCMERYSLKFQSRDFLTKVFKYLVPEC